MLATLYIKLCTLHCYMKLFVRVRLHVGLRVTIGVAGGEHCWPARCCVFVPCAPCKQCCCSVWFVVLASGARKLSLFACVALCAWVHAGASQEYPG